jgi:3-hydroxyacyl-CoA dehydrogenase
MKIEDVRCVLIVGAGTMGQQIGLQCAMHGYKVVVYDIVPEALEAANAQIKAYVAHLVSQTRLTRSESDAVLARLSFTTNPADAARADLISESVPEDPALKAKVFAQFNKLCPPHTIFTTNTSSLAVCRRGIAERVLTDRTWSISFDNPFCKSATCLLRGFFPDGGRAETLPAFSRPLTHASASG